MGDQRKARGVNGETYFVSGVERWTIDKEENRLAGCSKSPSSEAAGESKPETYPQGYVEDFDELRTKLAGFFSILLARGR
jgi:hypothetical protein